MVKTLNQLIAELRAIQEAHLQINDFYWGDFLGSYKEVVNTYPLMQCYYNSGAVGERLTAINLFIFVCDVVVKKKADFNADDVESDTLQIVRDIYNTINKSRRWKTFSRVASTTSPVEKFIERGGDYLWGHMITISLELKDSASICDLPMPGYDFDQAITVPTADCADATALLYDEGGRNLLETKVIASGDTANLFAPNGDISINNTPYGDVASGGSTNIPVQYVNGTPVGSLALGVWQIPDPVTCDDATAVLKDTAGATLSTTNIASGASQDITAPDGNVQNSDSTYNTNVKSNGGLILPDMNLSNSDGSYDVDYPSVKDIVTPDIIVTDQDGATSSYPSVKNLDIRNYRSGILYRYPMTTGQTTSYRTGDEGWHVANGSYNYTPPAFPAYIVQKATFTTLTGNNMFGNTNRFTDDVGTQVYSNNLVLDHFSKLMWYRVIQGTNNWNIAIDNAQASTQGGYSDWRLPTVDEFVAICDMELAQTMNYAPFSGFQPPTGGYVWTGTTNVQDTTRAYANSPHLNASNSFNNTRDLKASAANFYYFVRTFS